MFSSNSATGVIIDFEQIQVSRSGSKGARSSVTKLLSIIQFKDDKNQIISFSSAPHSRNKYHKGDKVTVYYNPNNPYEVKLNQIEGTWTRLFLLGFFAFMSRKIGREALYE
jgi:hypothetical protein